MNINIYFAGSIRGGQGSKSDYQWLIQALKQFGTVLTEHIADDHLLKNEQLLTDAQIHDRDFAWLKESQLVVAEITQPSLGVGYELAQAMFLKKPVLCLFNTTKGNRPSAMIAGQPYYQLIGYQEVTSTLKLIEEYINRTFDEQT